MISATDPYRPIVIKTRVLRQRRYEAVDLCQSVANEGSVVAE